MSTGILISWNFIFINLLKGVPKSGTVSRGALSKGVLVHLIHV